MNQNFVRVFTISSALLLASCGDGWEFQKTDSHFPYGNQRTAGSGVAYVLAKMMPEKDLKIEPVVVVEPEVTPEPVVKVEQPTIQPADSIFEDVQTKGGSSHMKKTSVAPSASEYIVPVHQNHASAVTEAETVIVAAIESESLAATSVGVAPPPPPITTKEAIVIKETQVSAIETSLEPVAGEIAATSFSGLSEQEAAEALAQATPHAGFSALTAEDYITQAPKAIDVPEVQILQAPKNISEIEERAALRAKEHVVEIYESSVEQPTKSIVSPKRDTVGYKSYGQETLEEIYENQF